MRGGKGRGRPLAVAAGDPDGVGPLVAVRALGAVRPPGGALLFGDGEQLARLARQEGLAAEGRGWLRIVDVGRRAPGAAQLEALREAARAAASGRAAALVTAPVSKARIAAVEPGFRGQTEWLARLAGLAEDEVTMCFLGPRLRVALVTTHLPLSAVEAAVTAPRLRRTVEHLCEALGRLGLPAPLRVGVCGLDPHLGEGGLLGRCDAETVAPELRALGERLGAGCRLLHLPAETAFRLAAGGELDGVVAMYHDQGTVPSKLLDWGRAVNVTWGLPFVRTSPDHGVGYEAARRGAADASGMEAAVRLALRLAAGEERP